MNLTEQQKDLLRLSVPWNAKRASIKYENHCPLLAQKARERLRHCRRQRESQLDREITLAETRLRGRYEELARVKGKRKRASSEIALRQEITATWQQIVGVATTVTVDGVREFANGLLDSQGRLGVNADWLREYTARLVTEIRDRVNTSQVFQMNPLLPWQQDSIAQKAIQTCEEAIAERRKIGDRWAYSAVESSGGNPTWPTVVQEWEAFKATQKIESGPPERIPESVLRNFLAGHYGIKPKDVDWEQIRLAGADLCRHYGPVLVIPLELETNRPAKAAPDSKATAQFWKEREDEFRKYDTPANCMSAVWLSIDEQWIFRSDSGVTASTLEAQQVFKPLAREAAKGLGGSRSAEPWMD